MKANRVLKILNVTRPTLVKYVKDGTIRTTTLPNGTYDYNDEDVYLKAELELIEASLENAEKFLSGSPIGYRNHERNKRGKLVKCEAYFM